MVDQEEVYLFNETQRIGDLQVAEQYGFQGHMAVRKPQSGGVRRSRSGGVRSSRCGAERRRCKRMREMEHQMHLKRLLRNLNKKRRKKHKHKNFFNRCTMSEGDAMKVAPSFGCNTRTEVREQRRKMSDRDIENELRRKLSAACETKEKLKVRKPRTNEDMRKHILRERKRRKRITDEIKEDKKAKEAKRKAMRIAKKKTLQLAQNMHVSDKKVEKKKMKVKKKKVLVKVKRRRKVVHTLAARQYRAAFKYSRTWDVDDFWKDDEKEKNGGYLHLLSTKEKERLVDEEDKKKKQIEAGKMKQKRMEIEEQRVKKEQAERKRLAEVERARQDELQSILQLFVMMGSSWKCFAVCASETVMDLQHQIEDLYGISSVFWYLIMDGRVLPKKKKISTLLGRSLTLQLRMLGGMQNSSNKNQRNQRYQYIPEDHVPNVDDEEKNVENENEKKESKVDNEHMDVDNEETNVDNEHANVDNEHEKVDNEHANVDNEHEKVDNEHANVDYDVEEEDDNDRHISRDPDVISTQITKMIDYLRIMKWSLAIEDYVEFHNKRGLVVEMSQELYDNYYSTFWGQLCAQVEAENVINHVVDLWMLAENDPFMDRVITRVKWKGLREFVQRTCSNIPCEVTECIFYSLPLSSARWKRLLLTIGISVELIHQKQVDIIAVSTDFEKIKLSTKLTTKRLPQDADAVQIKLTVDARQDRVILSIATRNGWADAIISAIFECLWQDGRLRAVLKQEMRAAMFGFGEGLRFAVITQWRKQNPNRARLLSSLGEESCDRHRIDEQCRLIKEKFGESYYDTLFQIMVNFFKAKREDNSFLKAHVAHYNRLLRAVPRFEHSEYYPLPMTTEEIEVLMAGQAIDFRREDGKWIRANVLINELSKQSITLEFPGKIGLNGRVDEESKEECTLLRSYLNQNARCRELGRITSRGLHRREMTGVLQNVSTRAPNTILVRIPKFFIGLDKFRDPVNIQKQAVVARVVERDLDSAQVLVHFDPLLYISGSWTCPPALWIHLDDVTEVILINDPAWNQEYIDEEAAVLAQESMQRDCDACPAFESAPRTDNVLSVSGFIVLRMPNNNDWIDVANIGKANCLPNLLLGIARDIDFTIGSLRAKKVISLRFTTNGHIELRFPRNVLGGHFFPGTSSSKVSDPMILQRLMLAPIAKRLRMLNLSRHAERKPECKTQLHSYMHDEKNTVLTLASEQGFDGLLMFGELNDNDLWRTRLSRQVLYNLQQKPSNKSLIIVSRCLGTMHCPTRSCSQFNHVLPVPQPRTQRRRKAKKAQDNLNPNWNLCRKCNASLIISACSHFVFDFKDFSNVLSDSRFPRIVVALGVHDEHCTNAPFASPSDAADAFLARKLAWTDWNLKPSVLRAKQFTRGTDENCEKPFVLGQVHSWYSGEHIREAMRRIRRRHMRELGVTRRDQFLFDKGISKQLQDTVRYVEIDKKAQLRIIMLWHPKLVECIARNIQRKRCSFYEDADYVAQQIAQQHELVDLIMPLIGFKDATFDFVRTDEMKLIDSMIWSDEFQRFIYFTFCISNSESRGVYFVSFLVEILEICKVESDLRKIAQSLRYVFDLCSKCRVGFCIAWAAIHRYRDKVETAYAKRRLHALFQELTGQHDELQAWTHQWFGKAKIPFSIQPDKVHVDRLFIDLRKLVSSEKKEAFKEAAHYLTQAMSLEDGLKRLNSFMLEWQDEPGLKIRMELLKNPYYIRLVFHWGRNVARSDILQYLTYSTSNPIESLHNVEKIASNGGKLSVLGCIEVLRGMLLSQKTAHVNGFVHKHGAKRNQMRTAALKGIAHYKKSKDKRSSHAAGRLDRCKKRNVGNVRCRYTLNINALSEITKGTRIYVYGWKNSVYSAEKEFSISTLGIMYPGLNSVAKTCCLDATECGFIGKMIAVIEHWNSAGTRSALLPLTRFFVDEAEHSKERQKQITKSTWRKLYEMFKTLKERKSTVERMLDVFGMENEASIGSLETTSIVEDAEWKTFAETNNVHWIGSDVNHCWQRITSCTPISSFELMAERLREKQFAHSYIFNIDRPGIDDWFLLKLTHVEHRLIFCWYYQFANHKKMKGKVRCDDENPGIWRTLHAVERDLAMALFWHGGVQSLDKELWATLDTIQTLWYAFDMESREFLQLCRECNTEDFDDDEDIESEWKRIQEDVETCHECLERMSNFAYRESRNLEQKLHASHFPTGANESLRRVLAMFKEHKRMHNNLWVSDKNFLVSIRHNQTEISEIVKAENSRMLGDIIRRGVVSLDLRHATTISERKSRRESPSLSQQDQRSQHQLLPCVALAGEQLRDLRCVSVMESATCYGQQARPVTLNLQSLNTAETQDSTHRKSMTGLDLLQLVIRTQNEIERGVQQSQFVCWECIPVEREQEPYVQCSKCPMLLHLRCADISFSEMMGARRDALRWICFSCLGMGQLNFTSSVHRSHEANIAPRQYKCTRNHLLQKVNRIGGNFACSLELRYHITPVLYLALWLKPIRETLLDQYLFKHHDSDAFLLGMTLLKMSEHFFLPVEELLMVQQRLPAKMNLVECLTMLLDAYASVCTSLQRRLTCSFTEYSELKEKAVKTNITVVTKMPTFEQGNSLLELSETGALQMILTRQGACILITQDTDNDEAFEIGTDLIIRKRAHSYWQPFQQHCAFFYFQEEATFSEDPLKNLVAYKRGSKGNKTASQRRVHTLEEIACHRTDVTRYVRSALGNGHVAQTFIGPLNLEEISARRRILVKDRLNDHLQRHGGQLRPSFADGNCLVRCFAQYLGKDCEIDPSIEENITSGRLMRANEEIFQLRQHICDYYVHFCNNGIIIAADEDEQKTCRANGVHLSLDFVRAYHLHEKVNICIIEYNETFDDFDVNRFYNSVWRRTKPPIFILRRQMTIAYHYDWICVDRPFSAFKVFTSQPRLKGTADVHDSIGWQTYRCFIQPPLRPKFVQLKEVDDAVWEWITNGDIVDNSPVGRICQQQNRIWKLRAQQDDDDTESILDIFCHVDSSNDDDDINMFEVPAEPVILMESEEVLEHSLSIRKSDYFIPKMLKSQTTPNERRLIFGFCNQIELSALVPDDVTSQILAYYRRPIRDWEKEQSSTIIGDLTRQRPLRNRPSTGDEEIFRRHYTAAKQLDSPLRGGCVMRFYWVFSHEAIYHPFRSMRLLPDCQKMSGSVQCQSCSIRIHPECSLVPSSPVCPWCVCKIKGIFKRDFENKYRTHRGEPLRNLLPLDLPPLTVPSGAYQVTSKCAGRICAGRIWQPDSLPDELSDPLKHRTNLAVRQPYRKPTGTVPNVPKKRKKSFVSPIPTKRRRVMDDDFLPENELKETDVAFIDNEKEDLARRISAVARDIDRRTTELWQQWLSSVARSISLRFQMDFSFDRKFLRSSCTFVGDDDGLNEDQFTKQQWWNMLVDVELGRDFLPRVLEIVEEIARRMARGVCPYLRSSFGRFICFELLITAMEATFTRRVGSATFDVFPADAFWTTTHRLHQSLVQYFPAKYLENHGHSLRKSRSVWLRLMRRQRDTARDLFCRMRDELRVTQRLKNGGRRFGQVRQLQQNSAQSAVRHVPAQRELSSMEVDENEDVDLEISFVNKIKEIYARLLSIWSEEEIAPRAAELLLQDADASHLMVKLIKLMCKVREMNTRVYTQLCSQRELQHLWTWMILFANMPLLQPSSALLAATADSVGRLDQTPKEMQRVGSLLDQFKFAAMDASQEGKVEGVAEIVAECVEKLSAPVVSHEEVQKDAVGEVDVVIENDEEEGEESRKRNDDDDMMSEK